MIFIILFLIYGTSCYSQIKFQEGYFITESGEKATCLIRNVEWKDNPTEFNYKSADGSEIQSKSINTVKEFGIDNYSKYRRFVIDIDRSSENVRNMNWQISPEFERDTLFLKILVEGEATLYVYQEGNIRRYFFETAETDVKQLIYKKYRKSENSVGVNEAYKSQLRYFLECNGEIVPSIREVSYSNDLVELFINYNNCVDSQYVNYFVRGPKSKLNFTIRPGIKRSSLVMRDGGSGTRNTNFGSEYTFRIGTEFEIILPFNRQKWGIIIEPTYQYFKKTVEYPNFDQAATINYSSLEIPLGVRHYHFINDRSKIFFNAFIVYDTALNKELSFEIGNDLEVRTSLSYVLGLGYKYNNWLSAELRHLTSRNIVDVPTFYTDYKSFSLLIGLTLF